MLNGRKSTKRTKVAPQPWREIGSRNRSFGEGSAVSDGLGANTFRRRSAEPFCGWNLPSIQILSRSVRAPRPGRLAFHSSMVFSVHPRAEPRGTEPSSLSSRQCRCSRQGSNSRQTGSDSAQWLRSDVLLKAMNAPLSGGAFSTWQLLGGLDDADLEPWNCCEFV